VKKTYGVLQIIHGRVDRTSPTGSFVVIVGPSAAAVDGCSGWWRVETTLPARSSSGERVVNELEPKTGTSDGVPELALYPHMSVYDNMATA